MILDYSTKDLYEQCPRKFYLRSICSMDVEDVPSPLIFGGCWHYALEHRARGESLDKAKLAFLTKYASEMPSLREGDIRTPDKGLELLDAYWVQYGQSDPWIYEQVELGFAIDIGGIHLYTGKVDAVIKMGPSRDVLDWKTTFQLGPQYFKQYSLDEQMMGYLWAARQYWENVQGVWIDAIQVAKNKTTMQRERFIYRESLLQQWQRETIMWLEQIQRSIDSQDFPKHGGSNCYRWGECQFHPICSSGIHYTPDDQPPPGFTKRTWQPWQIKET